MNDQVPTPEELRDHYYWVRKIFDIEDLRTIRSLEDSPHPEARDLVELILRLAMYVEDLDAKIPLQGDRY